MTISQSHRAVVGGPKFPVRVFCHGADANALQTEPFETKPPHLAQLCRQFKLDLDSRLILPDGQGGDLWGVTAIDDQRLALFCADFCGHGREVAAQPRNLYDIMGTEGFPHADPSQALAFINNRLKPLLPLGGFLAMTYVVIDFAFGHITCAAAAAPPLLLRSGPQKVWQSICLPGLPLGFLADQKFEAARFDFAAGASLVVYSDAIIETPMPPHNRLNPAQLETLVSRLGRLARACDVTNAIMSALDIANHAPVDDLTLVSLVRL